MVAGQQQTLDNMLVLLKSKRPGLHLQSKSQYIADVPHIRIYAYTQLSYQELLLAALVHCRASKPLGTAICAGTNIPARTCRPISTNHALLTQHVFPPLQKLDMSFHALRKHSTPPLLACRARACQSPKSRSKQCTVPTRT